VRPLFFYVVEEDGKVTQVDLLNEEMAVVHRKEQT